MLIPKRYAPLEVIKPANASALSPSCAVSSTYKSTWLEVEASAANTWVVQGAYLFFTFSLAGIQTVSLSVDVLMQLGTGAVGSEVPIANFVNGATLNYVGQQLGDQAFVECAAFVPCEPTLIPAGTRTAVHGTCDIATPTPLVSIYLVGYEVTSGYALPVWHDRDIDKYLRARQPVTRNTRLVPDDSGTSTSVVQGGVGTGTLTDTSKNWPTNCFAGCTATSAAVNLTIASNTATVLTGTWSGAPATGKYEIASPGTNVPIGSGTAWTFGAWTTVIPANLIANQYLLRGIAINSPNILTVHTQGEIGIGSGPTSASAFALMGRTGFYGPCAGLYMLPRPILMKPGEAASVRLKNSTTRTDNVPCRLLVDELP